MMNRYFYAIILPFIITFILCVSFSLGRSYERDKQNEYWLKDFKYQSKQVDSLKIRAESLSKEYKEIKNSDCYKYNHSK